MKNFLLISFMFLLSCSSCKKQPVTPDNPIIGTWVSKEPILQFPIKSTDGSGDYIAFLKFEKDGKDYLKVTYPKGEDTYIIKHIGKNEMTLVDTTGKDISFFRFE